MRTTASRRETRARSPYPLPPKITVDGSPSLGKSGLSTHLGNAGREDLSLFGPPRAQKLGDRPNWGWVRERSEIKGASITGVSIRGQAPVRSALNEIPTNGIPRPPRKNIQLTKN